MKSDEYYALYAVNKGLNSLVEEFNEELETLDPSATFTLRLIVAKLQGVSSYVWKASEEAKK